MKDKRIIFMGTADFSEAVLKSLIENNYNVVAVVSQPDRAVGRKKVLQETLVKKVAKEHNIPCIQPENIKKEYQEILDYQPDLIITAAYGQIVPVAVLKAPTYGCINVHASLLPKLRGGAPVHKAIIDGDDKTGVTIMYMAKKMDAGDIIRQEVVSIESKETVATLYKKLTDVGAKLLIDTLPDFFSGNFTAVKQDESQVTFAPTISREDEFLTFDKSARSVELQVRGLNDWPVAYSIYKDTKVKIWMGEEVNDTKDLQPGTIYKIDKTGIYVACKENCFKITELQVPGKKNMQVRDIINGKHIFEVGQSFEKEIQNDK